MINHFCDHYAFCFCFVYVASLSSSFMMTDSCVRVGNKFETTTADIVSRHCDLTRTAFEPAATVTAMENQFVMNAANVDVARSDASFTDVTEDEPVIDIVISNVVCTFNTKCHLNLKRLATEGMNVVYKREQGVYFCLKAIVLIFFNF